MRCARGHENAAGARFCVACGLALEGSDDVEERLTAAVEPPRIPVAAGAEVSGELVVRNIGALVEHARIAIGGSAAAWSRVEPEALRIMPGQSASATIRLRPPRAPTTPAGAHPLIVEARPVDRPGIAARADAIVDVAPFDLIAARVVPHQAKRWKRSEHRLELTNSGNAPVLVDVAATDADDLLWFRPLPQQASVPPGSRVALRFSASARSWRLLGRQPAAREFTVSATSREGTTVTAPGVLRQRALITFVTVLLALIALLLIVLIAGGLNR